MEEKQPAGIIYLGRRGAGLGFRLAGIEATDCHTPQKLLSELTKKKKEAPSSIIFVDEELAEQVTDEIQKMSEGALPAVVMVAGPGGPRHIGARKMDGLLVKAVGSDVFF